MTIIYLIVSLIVLLAVALIAYLVRGPKFALGISIATLVGMIVIYLALVIFVTSRMQ